MGVKHKMPWTHGGREALTVRQAASQRHYLSGFDRFPICQDRSPYGAKGAQATRQECPANSYDIRGGSECGEVQKEGYLKLNENHDGSE